ncbi:MAG TPA: HD domain-containing phosphohydrolase [Solirubrobacterales bacterium]
MAPIPIYVKDRSLHYIRSNTPAEKAMGLGKGELIGKTDYQIMSRKDADRQHESDLMVLNDGTTFEAVETLELTGVSQTFRTVKFPLLNETGDIVALCGIATDITAQLEGKGLNNELANTQRHAIDEQHSSRQETVEGLAGDQHVNRMANVAGFLGKRLGLPPERVELLRVATTMHDIGKFAVPDEILHKRGRLTTEERKEIEQHTVVGYEILADSDSELLQLAATVALTHHERFDGSGYPQGLKGKAIPLEGRITAVADVFDALLSDRPHRPAFPLSRVVATMKKGRGTQFDPEVADILLDMLEGVLSLRANRPPALHDESQL